MNLLTMQELAKSKQEQLDRFGEDWKSKVAQIPEMVDMVKGWQKVVFEKFGEPRVHSKKKSRGWLDVSPGQLLPLEEVTLDNTEFNGATVVQGLSLELEHQDKAVVTYKAILMTDENYFLRQMLPSTVDIPVHDPAYDLISVEIEVPRSQLVKESLFALDGIVGAKEDYRRIKKLGRWSKKHWRIFGLIGGIATVASIIYSVGTYIATLPGEPAATAAAPAAVEESAGAAASMTPAMTLFGMDATLLFYLAIPLMGIFILRYLVADW